MSAVPTGRGDADIAYTAGLFADRTRARILSALADGRRLSAGALAAEAGVSAQAASAQLARLRDAGLLAMELSGRHRYFRLASGHVAAILEALAAAAPALPVLSLRQSTRARALRAARTCYDHLAGRLGVAVTQALLDQDALVPLNGGAETIDPPTEHPYGLGPRAAELFTALGVDSATLTDAGRRPLLRFCLDWSEQRHHLAGRLGAELLTAMTSAGWLEQRPRQRAVQLTPTGDAHLRATLGLAPS